MKTLPMIRRPKMGATAIIAAGFPTTCPCCQAKRVSIVGSTLEQRTATYGCGAQYAPAAADDEHNVWIGVCPASQE